MVEFDDLDRGLLHALQVDGRAPFRRIADVLGVSDQTVARRYARLRSVQALRVIGFSDPVLVGDDQWMVRARCAPPPRRRSPTRWPGARTRRGSA